MKMTTDWENSAGYIIRNSTALHLFRDSMYKSKLSQPADLMLGHHGGQLNVYGTDPQLLVASADSDYSVKAH